MKKLNLFLVLILILTTVLVGCGSNSTPAEKPAENTTEQPAETNETPEQPEKVLAENQTLIIGADAEPAGIDPHKSTSFSSARVTTKIYESLVQTDENMNVIPSLAKSWENPDDSTYVFKLKQGVKFHNGREMTADDVKYSFERILNPDNACIAKSYFKKVTEINVIDEYTVEFKLSEPYAPFMSYLTSVYASIIPKEVVEENGDLMQVACGTGAFMLDEWIPDNQMTLIKNPEYHVEGQPKLDSVVLSVLPDESSRLAALRTGAVHLTTLGSQNIELVEKNEDVIVKSYQSKNYTFLGFNMNIEPFNNVKVRQAMSLAVDREELAKIVYNGEAVVSGPVPPAYGKWALDVENNQYFKQDIEKAKALLKEAGYEDGFEVEITVPSSYAEVVSTAQVLIQQFEKIGITATIKQLEIGQYVDAWKTTDHQVMAGLNGSGTDPDRAISFFFNTEGSANVWGYSDEVFDELTNEGKVTVDPAKRVELYLKAQERLFEQSPNIFFNAPMKYYFVRSNIEGFNPNVFNSEDLRNIEIYE